MSLRRSATRKEAAAAAGAGAVAASKKTTRDKADQGLQVMHPKDGKGDDADIDIVLVPGLGANPHQTWIHPSSPDFNWTGEQGLAADFPKSRILLYNYLSAWIGKFQVEQFMTSISRNLLVALKSLREKCPKRPIVFIGHSMGGLVIAKAITLMVKLEERSNFPNMFESTGACFFFGTPFKGTDDAGVAAMVAYVAEKFSLAQPSKLLDYMKVGSPELADMRDDFVKAMASLKDKIRIICFFETVKTDTAKMAKIPALLGFTNLVFGTTHILVTKESATLDGRTSQGIDSDHRNLVRVDKPDQMKWNQYIRAPMKEIIRTVPMTVRKRFKDSSNVSREVLDEIERTLDSNVQGQLKRAHRNFTSSSWMATNKDFTNWLEIEPPSKTETLPDTLPLPPTSSPTPSPPPYQCPPCIWVRGAQGRGKTGAILAALDEAKQQKVDYSNKPSHWSSPVLIAYFFCAPEADYRTAEDVMKALIWQLVDQNNALATYAKVFIKSSDKNNNKAASRGGSEFQATMTIENLWQVLQDMLNDEDVGHRVYLLINNLHVLDGGAPSTRTFMNLLKHELESSKTSDAALTGAVAEAATTSNTIRWFITSRDAPNIPKSLDVQAKTILIDLEDAKYANEVHKELRAHAKSSVSKLGDDKAYNRAIRYFATSIIGKRAENTHWIDIIVAQLRKLSNNDLHVRILLEETPMSLPDLLTQLWLRIFSVNDEANILKEVLRCLVLTYEEPSELELAALAGLDLDEKGVEALRRYVTACEPLLSIKEQDNGPSTVHFIKPDVKLHLLQNAETLIGLSPDGIKLQHGLLALRSFSHVRSRFDFPLTDREKEQIQREADGMNDSEGSDESEEESEEEEPEQSESEEEESDDEGAEEDSEVEEESYDSDSATSSEDGSSYASSTYSQGWAGDANEVPESELKGIALDYLVQYWLKHSSEATTDIAEDLSQEAEFWCPNSIIRRRWLSEYNRLTDLLSGFDKDLPGLHIVAAAGFADLIKALIECGHQDEIDLRDRLTNTPLHFAAFLGPIENVKVLLDQDASVDDGKDVDMDTPLCMAASKGRVEIMSLLLNHKADINAVSKIVGPVISAAILSGKQEAVTLLVNEGVSMIYDSFSPLALSARRPDMSMFNFLTSNYTLPDEEFSYALISAARADRMELFDHLLTRKHDPEYYQRALDTAAFEGNWDIVSKLLQTNHTFDCDCVILEATMLPMVPKWYEKIQQDILQTIAARPNSVYSSERLASTLYLAVDHERTNGVRLLLDLFKADPNATGKEYGNAVSASAYDGTEDILTMLLKAGAELNGPNDFSLQLAAEQGHTEIIRILLEHKADINHVTKRSPGTAIQAACESGNLALVKWLLEQGADPKLGKGEISPPLIAAACQGEAEILEVLVKAGADVNARGGWERSSVLIYAALCLETSSVELLLDHGADINPQDRAGDTPLIAAAIKGDLESILFLLKHHADVTHRNKRHHNALQVALIRNHMDCVYALSEYMSNLVTAVKRTDKGALLRSVLPKVKLGSKYEHKYRNSRPRSSTPPPPTEPALPEDAAQTFEDADGQGTSPEISRSDELRQENITKDTSAPEHEISEDLPKDKQEVSPQPGEAQLDSLEKHEQVSHQQNGLGHSRLGHQDQDDELEIPQQPLVNSYQPSIDLERTPSMASHSQQATMDLPLNQHTTSEEGRYGSATNALGSRSISHQSPGEELELGKADGEDYRALDTTAVGPDYSIAHHTSIDPSIPMSLHPRARSDSFFTGHEDVHQLPYGGLPPAIQQPIMSEATTQRQGPPQPITRRKPVPTSYTAAPDPSQTQYSQFHAAMDNLTIEQPYQPSPDVDHDQYPGYHQPYAPSDNSFGQPTRASQYSQGDMHEYQQQQPQMRNNNTMDGSPPELNQKRSSFFTRTTFDKIIRR